MTVNYASIINKDLTLDEVVEKYTDIPRLIIIKIDVQRRGVHYTDKALEKLDPSRHQIRGAALFGSRDNKLTPLPESLILRDGTTVLTDPTPLENNPYVVDYEDDRLVLKDNGKVIEEVEFWPKPDFYGKKTASGKPMEHIVTARPQRLQVMPSSYCHFWDNGHGCKYCDIVNHLKHQKAELGVPAKLNLKRWRGYWRSLKHRDDFSGIGLTAGIRHKGQEPFDEEVEYYIELLKHIGQNFKTKKFPSQLIATAFTEKQLKRLYDETGLMGYTADIEVLNEDLFNWICPGKAEWIGYNEWKNRLVELIFFEEEMKIQALLQE
jgi:hypothetical protein